MKGLSKIIGLILILMGIPLFANAQPQLSLGSATGEPGGTASMTLSLSSDGTEDYAGVNAQIVLPEGVTLSGVTPGALLSAAFTDDSNDLSGTFIAYSGTDVFSAASGVLLTLNLQIGSEVVPGDYSVVFADSDENSLVNPEHALSNADGLVSVTHGTYAEEDNLTVSSGSATPPTVTTTAVTSITSISASSGGNITSNGGASVTARGVCWSTSQNPTTGDNKTTDSTGSGSFSSNITGLNPGTTYHVRAYATNSEGTAYGNDLPFTTEAAVAPTVTTTAVTSITSISASSGGNITSNGGASVTARGVCWSTSQDPNTGDNKTTDNTGTGSFTSDITGLNPGTTYHVRAYATNSEGTAYGNDLPFTTEAAVTVPTVTTTAVTSITSISASSGGNITSNGGASVTARGVCWSTSQDPTTGDNKTTDSTGSGSFSSNITGLNPGTTYHVRAYATNSEGPAYGSDVSWKSSEPPTVLYVSISGDCGEKTPCYDSIQEAINAATTGNTIMIAQGTYSESIILNTSKTLILQGGWNSAFTSQDQQTIIKAPKANQGALRLQTLTVRP